MSDDFELAELIAGCESQLVHQTGEVQSFGLLLRCDADDRVTHVSANLRSCLGIVPEALLGKPVTALIDAEALRELRAGNTQLIETRIEGERYDLVAAEVGDDGVIIEANPALPEQELPEGAEFAMLREVEEDCDLASSLARLTGEIRKITGYDRVVVYRFDDDWSGEVVAESGGGDLPSYMGLRFPASDIPEPARKLYLQHPWRLIADVDAATAPLISTLADATLNLTHCDLRSVAPVHLEYLRNMGVKASFSVSLLLQGKLWGLIACHHPLPRYLGYPLRRLCHYIARAFAIRLLAIQARNRLRLVDSVEHRIDDLTRRLVQVETEGTLPAEVSERLLEMLEADGAMLVSAEGLYRIRPGASRSNREAASPDQELPEEELLYLDEWFMGLDTELIAETSIQARCPWMTIAPQRICGLLAIRTPVRDRDGSISWLRFYWWRSELPQHVRWAGAPQKRVDRDERGIPYLSPRRSFEEWRELKRGASKAWSSGDLLTAKKFRGSVLRWLIHR